MNKVLIAAAFALQLLFTIVFGEHPSTCYIGFCAAGGACNEAADGAVPSQMERYCKQFLIQAEFIAGASRVTSIVQAEALFVLN